MTSDVALPKQEDTLCYFLHSYGKSQFLMGKSTVSMAIFHSYVKLPEGKLWHKPSE